MKTLEETIEQIKAGRTLKQLKLDDTKAYYRVKGLSQKLSEQKAFDNGNFITKQHLSEYRNLIIWALNKTNFRNYLNLKEAMSAILNEVEDGRIVYKTERGIKGIVTNMAFGSGLDNVDKNLREANGLQLATTHESRLLQTFTQFKMQLLTA